MKKIIILLIIIFLCASGILIYIFFSKENTKTNLYQSNAYISSVTHSPTTKPGDIFSIRVKTKLSSEKHVLDFKKIIDDEGMCLFKICFFSPPMKIEMFFDEKEEVVVTDFTDTIYEKITLPSDYSHNVVEIIIHGKDFLETFSIPVE